MSASLPLTATNKVVKRALRAERWNCTDAVLSRRDRGGPYEVLNPDDAAALEEAVGDRPL